MVVARQLTVQLSVHKSKYVYNLVDLRSVRMQAVGHWLCVFLPSFPCQIARLFVPNVRCFALTNFVRQFCIRLYLFCFKLHGHQVAPAYSPLTNVNQIMATVYFLAVHQRSIKSNSSRSFHVSSNLAKRDYYEVLGIPKGSSQADVKKAYYKVRYMIVLACPMSIPPSFYLSVVYIFYCDPDQKFCQQRFSEYVHAWDFLFTGSSSYT